MKRQVDPDVVVGERRPIGFAALLVFGMGVPTFLTASIGVLAPLIIADLGLTTAQFGALGTSVYLLAAVLAPLVGGRIDTMDERVSLLLLFAISGAAIVGMSLAGTYAIALAAVGLAGIVEAANTPVTNRLLSRHGAWRFRGLLMGLKQSGVKVSHLIAGAVLPPVAAGIGWRNSLLGSTVLVLSGVLLAVALVPGSRGPRTPRTPRGARAPLPPGVWGLVAYAFLMALGQAPFQLYITLYAIERVGMTLAQGGLAFALANTIAIGARVAWGIAADRAVATHRALVVLAGGSALSTLGLMAADPGGPWLIWTGAVGIGMTAAVWSTLVHLTVVHASDEGGATGRATGIVHMAFLAGMSLSPLVFGLIVDAVGYRIGWIFAVVAFIVAGVVSVVTPGPSPRSETPVVAP